MSSPVARHTRSLQCERKNKWGRKTTPRSKPDIVVAKSVFLGPAST